MNEMSLSGRGSSLLSCSSSCSRRLTGRCVVAVLDSGHTWRRSEIAGSGRGHRTRIALNSELWEVGLPWWHLRRPVALLTRDDQLGAAASGSALRLPRKDEPAARVATITCLCMH